MTAKRSDEVKKDKAPKVFTMRCLKSNLYSRCASDQDDFT